MSDNLLYKTYLSGAGHNPQWLGIWALEPIYCIIQCNLATQANFKVRLGILSPMIQTSPIKDIVSYKFLYKTYMSGAGHTPRG